MPRGIDETIASMGRVFDEAGNAKLIALYAEELRKGGPAAGNREADLSYGPHPRQKLDLHKPAGGTRPLGIVIYIHGGGFVAGDKNIVEGVIYANVGAAFAAAGMVAICANFRLPPDGVWPLACEDIGLVVAWAREHAAGFGLPRDARIVLTGHSSGATQVATYAFHRALPEPDAACAGAILLSGRYILPSTNPDPVHRDNFGRDKIARYYGGDSSLYAERQLIGNVAKRDIRTLLVAAEYDPPVFHRSTAALFHEMTDLGGTMPALFQLPGHNHMSEIAHIGTSDSSLLPRLIEFAKGCLG